MVPSEEIVRLTLQCLNDLGYRQTVKCLESESGLQSETEMITNFKSAIMDGDWQRAINQSLKVQDDNKFKFLIYKQSFQECLQQRNLSEALQILRNNIAVLQVDRNELHSLSAMMMLPPEKVQPLERSELKSQLLALISPNMILPEKRWQILYDQAQKYQVSKCLYHRNDAPAGSLFVDHACTRNNIPTTCIQTLAEHSDEVWYVTFSHDGRYMASASKDKSAIIWNVGGSWESKHHLQGHEDAVCFLAFSPNDKLLLTCGNDNKLRLWNVQDGVCLRVFAKNTDCVSSCAWMPDNKRFVSSSLDKNIFLWDSDDGSLLHRWTGARVSDLAVTSDGKFMIAACHDKLIRVYDILTKEESNLTETDPITSLSLSPDDKYLLVSVSSQEIHLWSMDTRKIVAKYIGHKQGKFVIRSQFGSNNFIISGSEDNNVYIWNRNHPELPPLECLIAHTGTCNSVAWNPVNDSVLASASDDCSVKIWGVVSSQKE